MPRGNSVVISRRPWRCEAVVPEHEKRADAFARQPHIFRYYLLSNQRNGTLEDLGFVGVEGVDITDDIHVCTLGALAALHVGAVPVAVGTFEIAHLLATAVEDIAMDIVDIALDGGIETIVGFAVGGKGIGHKLAHLDQGNAGEGSIVAAVIVVDGQPHIHGIDTGEGEDNAGLCQGAGLTIGEEPNTGVVAIGLVGEFDGELVDGGNLRIVRDDGLHRDDGEIEGDGRVAAPSILQHHGILLARIVVVGAVGAAVEPGIGLAVEHAIGGEANIGYMDMEMFDAVAARSGIIAAEGVDIVLRLIEINPFGLVGIIPAIRLATAETHGVEKLIVRIGEDADAIVIVAAVAELGGAKNPGSVDLVGDMVAGARIVDHRNKMILNSFGDILVSPVENTQNAPGAGVERLLVSRVAQGDGGRFAIAYGNILGNKAHGLSGIDANGDGVAHTAVIDAIEIVVSTAIDALDHVLGSNGGGNAHLGMLGVEIKAIGVAHVGGKLNRVDNIAGVIGEKTPPTNVFGGFALRGETPSLVGGFAGPTIASWSGKGSRGVGIDIERGVAKIFGLMVVGDLILAIGILDTNQTLAAIGGRAAVTLLDVNLDDVGALVADNLIGIIVVVVAVKVDTIDRGAKITAGIGATHAAEHAAGGGVLKVSGVDILIHAIDGIVGIIAIGERSAGDGRIVNIGAMVAGHRGIERDDTIGAYNSLGVGIAEEHKGEGEGDGGILPGIIGADIEAGAGMESGIYRVVRNRFDKVIAVEMLGGDKRRCVEENGCIIAIDQSIPAVGHTLGRLHMVILLGNRNFGTLSLDHKAHCHEGEDDE